MMTWRAQQAEHGFAFARGGERLQRGAYRAASVRENVRMSRRVTVEIGRSPFDPGQVRLRMSAFERGVLNRQRLGARDREFGLAAKLFERFGNARRTFRMAG